MITLHHLNNSRSQRIIWLLEELQLPYTITRYQRDDKTMLAPAALKTIHPLGKAPVISDGDVVVAESGAIIEYLVDKPGAQWLKPAADSQALLDYRYWLHYAEGSAMPPLLMSLVFSRLDQPPMPALLRPLARLIANGVRKNYLQPQLAMHFNHIEAHLAKNGWFAGNSFSAADIQMSFPLEAASARGLVTQQHPHIRAFLQTIHARPAYQAALQQGGPYAYA
ncbi:glutathione S-transferase [Aquitalea magnusonii]|uniref:glutathione transferase n=1 Tax=Aquitalea magnusonii TaxID=332411 RepID=A0A3G9GIY5_9NEIS|nr:glutathione S-transferase [Aquitalea magnusonii]BBF85356.1 glutathione S-transferase [Aquitalea magnusonii]